MTIPTKGRRRVRVGDEDYAWLIRKKPTYSQAAFKATMRVAIQSCAPGASCVLMVDLGVSRPDNWVAPHQTALTPAIVRDIIRKALEAGWVPSARKSPFELEYQLITDTIGGRGAD
jgi:hypothetical protein